MAGAVRLVLPLEDWDPFRRDDEVGGGGGGRGEEEMR